MSLKAQDIVVLVKLIAKKGNDDWSQNQIALELCLSPSQINSALKNLVISGLITPYHPPEKPQPILSACKEFFIHGLKYIFPAKLGELARGIPTSYAGPSLKKELITGNEPIPIWPYGKGEQRGLTLEPLYPSVPKAVSQYPDRLFYDLLTFIDAIRSGRAREKQLAEKNIINLLK